MFSFDFGLMKPIQEEWQFVHEGIDNGALDDNKHLLIPEISCPNIISSNFWATSNVDGRNHSQYLKKCKWWDKLCSWRIWHQLNKSE